jgi:hypothetical protein
LVAALLTTGCGENALMNPVGDGTLQNGGTVNAAKHDAQPAKHDAQPAKHDAQP